MKLSNLLIRAMAGAVYVALVIGSLLLGNVSFGLLCLFILIFSMEEYFKLTKRLKNKNPLLSSIVVAVIIFSSIIAFKNGLLEVKVLYTIPMVFLFFMIAEMMGKHRHPVSNVATTAFSFIYLLLPISCLYLIGFYNKYSWTNDFNYEILMGFFILNWASDTGAYLAGSAFGKTKLFERISPKKTIEGSLGGIVLTAGIAFALSVYFTDISTLDWLVIAILVAIFGTLGDLFESLLKRKAEVKDSGKIIPGHGGMLDRFDSIYFSAPVVFVYLNLIGH